MPQGWSEWGNAATAIGTILTGTALLLLAYQVHLLRREQRREAMVILYNDLNTTEFRQKLRFIYGCNPEELLLDNLSAENLDLVEFVTSRLDRIGFLVRTGQLPDKDVYHQFSDLVLKTAQKLNLHLEDQLKKRSSPEHKAKYNPDFRWIAKKCKMRQLRQNGVKLNKRIRRLPLGKLLEINPLPVYKLSFDIEAKNENVIAKKDICDLW